MGNIDFLLVGSEYRPSAGVGSIAERELGSGVSFPAFPGIVEYNSLVMNNYEELDHYRIISIDGLEDAELRDNRSPKPNADGENAYGSNYGGRTIVINGEIRSSHLWKFDDMRTMLISAFANKNKDFPLWFKTNNAARDRIINCRKNAKLEIPWTVPTRQYPVIPFMIPLRAQDPRLLSYLPVAINKTISTFTAVNAGNYESKLLIRFYGPCTTMTLAREHDAITQTIIVGPISAGSFVEIDGAAVTDPGGNNAYSLYSDDSDIMMLGAGPVVNNFTFSGTGTTSASQVHLEWRDSWIG